jgi:hypothetical protein
MTDSQNALKVFDFDGGAETASYSAARQEMKLAHMNAVSGRLNMELVSNYEGYCRAIQNRTLKEVFRSKLESLMTDFGGLSVEEVSDEEKGFWLLYVNIEPRDGPTLIFDGEFFVVENLARKIWHKEAVFEKQRNERKDFLEIFFENAVNALDGIKTVLDAIPKAQPVYIGDCGYYVHCLNPYVVVLHSQVEIDAFVESGGVAGGIRRDGLPVRKYILNIQDFREAVTSNPRNEGIIAKLGFTRRNPSIPFVPSLETEPGSEEFYAAGDRVFLDNDLECLIQVIGNGRVWYLNMSEMPGSAAGPCGKKVTVTVEWQRNFEKQFFGNLRNLELVRRRKCRELLDILAEMNRGKNFMRKRKEKDERRSNKYRGKR